MFLFLQVLGTRSNAPGFCRICLQVTCPIKPLVVSCERQCIESQQTAAHRVHYKWTLVQCIKRRQTTVHSVHCKWTLAETQLNLSLMLAKFSLFHEAAQIKEMSILTLFSGRCIRLPKLQRDGCFQSQSACHCYQLHGISSYRGRSNQNVNSA